MSYLGFPRIHFGGAFFSNPGNLNNLIDNYENATTDQPLIYDTGTYNNPTGVGQFYFKDCEVTQLIGEDGKVVTQDPLLSASVNTVNPTDRQQAEDGSNYILAKIADVDTDMQFRSELYGLRIFVKSADGYGFEGTIACPQLRDLFFARGAAGINGMQVASGDWHQRIVIEKWLNPVPGTSGIIDLLSANDNQELDIKLTVDMFQCDPGNEFSTGDMYLYGRLMATIGLVEPTAPKQIVAGRRLYSPTSYQGLNAAHNQSQELILTKEQAEKSAKALQNSTKLWSNCDAKVSIASDSSKYILFDLGPTTGLIEGGKGSFETGNIELGYIDNDSNFTAFASQGYTSGGSLVSVTEQLTSYSTLTAAAKFRDSVYLTGAGVVQIELTDSEYEDLSSLRLCILSDNDVVLKENKGGYYVNFEMAAVRMSPNAQLPDNGQTVNMTVFKFGQPVDSLADSSQLALCLATNVLAYSASIDQASQSQAKPTNIYRVTYDKTAISGKAGQFSVQICTGDGVKFEHKPTDLTTYNNWKRKPLDSQLCFVDGSGVENGNAILIGENPLIQGFPYIPAITLLFWQNQWVVNQPNWEDNIHPILNCYDILYPGMRSRLDIADKETVISNAKGMSYRFGLDTLDPAFMPVVRDMSPETIGMMQTWLGQYFNDGTGHG